MAWKPSAPATGQIWGAGWGGEPKGFTPKPARGGPPQPWVDPSARGREIWSAMSAEERAERRALAATKEAQMAQMREVWGDVALNGESEMARIAAAEKLYDRLDGKPVQTNVNLNKDLDNPEERRAEIDQLLAEREAALSGKSTQH